METVSAIILAGGNGERFHGKKQFIDFMGKPLWKHVYDTVVEALPNAQIVKVGVDIQGGSTRTESVINGLKKLNPDTKRVIILEAARPLVTIEQIQQLAEDVHDSATFVMPLVNTVIMRNGNYLNRNDLYELLTPQAFNYHLLLEAVDSEHFHDMTDETRIMFEYHNISPFFISTTENLVKVTYQRDLPIIEAIYRQMQQGRR